MFSKDFLTTLPPKRKWDIIITLREGKGLIVSLMYKQSSKDLDVLKEQLSYLLERKIRRPCQSPYGSVVLFVPKFGELFIFCVDFCALNKVTKLTMFPLPRMNEMLDKLALASVFSKIDLRTDD